MQEQVATECPAPVRVRSSADRSRTGGSHAAPGLVHPDGRGVGRRAEWFRCDVVALAADGELAPLAGELNGMLDKADGTRALGLCGTAEARAPGRSRGDLLDQPRLASAIGDGHVQAAAKVRLPRPERRCGEPAAAARTGSATSAKDPLSFTWGWTPPTEAQWAAGQRYGFCWAPAQ